MEERSWGLPANWSGIDDPNPSRDLTPKSPPMPPFREGRGAGAALSAATPYARCDAAPLAWTRQENARAAGREAQRWHQELVDEGEEGRAKYQPASSSEPREGRAAAAGTSSRRESRTSYGTAIPTGPQPGDAAGAQAGAPAVPSQPRRRVVRARARFSARRRDGRSRWYSQMLTQSSAWVAHSPTTRPANTPEGPDRCARRLFFMCCVLPLNAVSSRARAAPRAEPCKRTDARSTKRQRPLAGDGSDDARARAPSRPRARGRACRFPSGQTSCSGRPPIWAARSVVAGRRSGATLPPPASGNAGAGAPAPARRHPR